MRGYTPSVAVLYVVSTPIGNLKDITLRAIEVLTSVEVIAAEDTRTTKRLLAAHGISKRVIRCDSYSEENSSDGIVALLKQEKDIAYASDAGTPGFSDPGSVLVRKVREAGFDIVPIPGPSALTSLVSVSGISGKSVLFEGFLSPKAGKRRRRLTELCEMKVSFVIFESPFRVLKLLADIVDVCPERRIFIGREMTKMYEEFLDGNAAELLEKLEIKPKIRGEFSLLVASDKND
jgi:16S rRNA (cytidine1402-2'-O)-methyltransferase